MKRIPKNRPPRYIFEWVEEKKEYRCKKKYRFTDYSGKKRGSDTRWHWTIEECEDEARQKIAEASFAHYEDLRKDTLGAILDVYIERLGKRASRQADVKLSGDISKYENARGLKIYLKPDLADMKVSEMRSSNWRQWMKWINDEDEHKPLGGKRVRTLKTAMSKFASWLADEGYITDDDEDANKVSIKKVALKEVNAGAKHRNYPSYKDLEMMLWYYDQKGLGEFINFYWFTLWTVLYYSGMRVGELIALRWKNIEFGDENVITIEDAISHKEKRSNVARRIGAENLATKNETSVRRITMWAVYKDTFKNYKQSYQYHYNTTEQEMEEMFVFPNPSPKAHKDNNGFYYQDQKNMLRELDRTTQKVGLVKMDCQMFRHGCAYFLRDIMHISAAEAKDYFGHIDSKMIEKIYAKADVELRRKRADYSLKTLITEKDLPEFNKYVYGDTSAIRSFVEESEDLKNWNKIASVDLHLSQLKRAYDTGKREYHCSGDMARILRGMIREENEGSWMKEMNIIEDN